jgi:glycosyltransferase involved in cell wall biosynthesis
MGSVSIVIPLHDKGRYVADTITSIQAQTVLNWEAIVVENGSSDDGPERIDKISALDPRIRLVRAPESVLGPGAARNIGLDNATGEWVLFLDADDELDPRYLEHMLNTVSRHPDSEVVASPWVEFEAGKTPDEGIVKYPAGFNADVHRIEDSAIAHTCWAVHAAIVRREWLLSRKWPEELDEYLAEDTAFWFRVVCGAKVVYSDNPGAFYRTQTDNCRTDFSARAWFEGNHRAALANVEYLKELGRMPSRAQMDTLVRHYEDLYERARRAGEIEVANQALVIATEWLRKLGSTHGLQPTAISLRRVIGISNFYNLKSLKRAFTKA